MFQSLVAGAIAGYGIAIPVGPVAVLIIELGVRRGLRLAAAAGLGAATADGLYALLAVLAGAEAAIGLVIAAKTLARFKQLDDRDFAEYYLLGTLASVAIASISAFAAAAALGSLG